MNIACMITRRHFSISLKLFKSKTSSNIWLARQKKDPYVKRAVKETYRARSAFKLIEIDDQYKLFNHGDVVVDIGAAPGSWTQVVIKKTNSDGAIEDKKIGYVISVDRDHIEPLKGAKILPYCDIQDEKTIKKILDLVKEKPVTSVISDMAPNATGQKTFDHDTIIELQLKALSFAKKCLKQDGTFLCKLWFGDRTEEFKSVLGKNFETIKTIKPPASRSDSAECFLLALKYKP